MGKHLKHITSVEEYELTRDSLAIPHVATVDEPAGLFVAYKSMTGAMSHSRNGQKVDASGQVLKDRNGEVILDCNGNTIMVH